MRWRTMDEAEIEREYSPSSRLSDGDYRPFVAAYRAESDRVWGEVLQSVDVAIWVVRYGEAASQTVDLAVPRSLATEPAPDVAPLLVFIHGGYWQELSKLDSRFAALDCLARGWAFAAVDYTLAPAASLDEIVSECRRSVRSLMVNAEQLGFDPRRMFIAGSSAGAHLAAMVAADPVPADTARAAGLILVSGVFELEPLIDTSVNDQLGLDPSAARRNSPLLLDVRGFPPTLIAYGSNETGEFKAQSDVFAERLAGGGALTTTCEIAGRNHFDVIMDLARAGTPLGESVTSMIDG